MVIPVLCPHGTGVRGSICCADLTCKVVVPEVISRDRIWLWRGVGQGAAVAHSQHPCREPGSWGELRVPGGIWGLC